ncbi:MAG: dynamin family protein [Desulfovibrionaceae bacterium]|nr:dynamin family protein [Desulfovibrionaceae bacterium]
MVDTPGLGSTNPRHTDLAAKTAQNECDALLVLTSVHQPLSSELITFIRDITNGDTSGCIFVGTFKDQIPDSELLRQEKFFRQKLKAEFGSDYDPPIFFVSAYEALQGLNNQAYVASLNEFRSFKDKLFSFLEPRKPQLIQQRLVSLITHTVETLKSGFAVQKKCFLNEIQELENSLVYINKQSLDELLKVKLQDFYPERERIRETTESKLNSIFTTLLDNVRAGIFGCTSSGKLKHFLNHYPKKYITEAEKQIENVAEGEFRDSLNRLCKRILNAYQEEIKMRYETIREKQKYFSADFIVSNPCKSVGFTTEATIEGNTIGQEFSKEDLQAKGGSIVAGALIGAAVGGPVGAAVGAFAGFVVSFFVSDSDLEGRKRDAYDRISDAISNARDSILSTFNTNINEAFGSAEKDLRNKMAMQINNSLAIVEAFNKEKHTHISEIKAFETELDIYENQLTQLVSGIKEYQPEL